jgi:hypothetical protein
VLGIDPSATIPDHNGRPQYLLEDREPMKELIWNRRRATERFEAFSRPD